MCIFYLSHSLTVYIILLNISTKRTTQTAYDLTYEGGELVPPFQKDYLEGFIKKQKAIVSMMNGRHIHTV